ncbi:MAG: TM2 domain-containing protein [Clostridiales bacterium]|nr:TM2 domain-containing protein [Clostridiales bacterium]
METEQKAAQQAPAGQAPEKFCKHCGGKIPADAVVCTLCGRQVEQMAQSGAPNIVINNANQNTNSNVNAYVAAKARNKWVALCLCLFLGVFGAHKFYEGKAGLGVLYLFTGGLLGIGAVIDFITILFKPNPYFV